MYSGRPRAIGDEKLNSIFTQVEQKLTDGLSAEAAEILGETIENYAHTADNLANLKSRLSYTLETLGRYQDALEAVKSYEPAEKHARLQVETQLKVITQLATCYSNLSEYPKAITLLKQTLERAESGEMPYLLGNIYIALARVYRKLNEFTISRDYGEKALEAFREHGNWRGMAESYQTIAIAHYQEGSNEKSLKFFELAVQIIGTNPAPFILGKIYSDMSGAYCLLHRPQDGIDCLEKSIGFFDRTEHKLNSVIAYNNLGMNLMLLGDWTRAEKMMNRALELAQEANHAHVAGILDSIGELKLLRGELAEAEKTARRSGQRRRKTQKRLVCDSRDAKSRPLLSRSK